MIPVFCCFCCLFLAILHPLTASILGLGHAVMDLIAQVDDEFLTNYMPVKKREVFFCEEELFQQILSQYKNEPQISPGGNTTNTLRVLATLSEPCTFLSSVGNDQFGQMFCHNLKELGIERKFVPSADSTTIRIACLVTPDTQRTFLGTGPEIWTDPLDESVFEDAKWVHIEGRLLKSRFPLREAMQFAKKRQIPISIDVSSCQTIHSFKEELFDLIANYVDIVFWNEEEILAITGLAKEAGCLALHQICPTVVVTIGAEGCLVAHNQEVLHVQGFPACAIDTTGAGDVFAGGFLYGYLRGYPLLTCARIGNFFGSSIVEVLGAQLTEEKWDKIHLFLDQEELVKTNI